MDKYLAFPYQIGPNGLTAQAPSSDHLSQLIEEVLFVEPGERVNRPQFGCPIRQMIFNGGSSQITAAVEALVQSALRQWLGDVIQLRSVDVALNGTRVGVVVRYIDVQTQETKQISLVG